MKNTKISEAPKLSELSLDELIKEEKKRSAAHISFCVIIVMMVGVSIYITIKKGFTAFTPLPLAFMPLYLLTLSSWRNARKEIKFRNTK